MLDKKPYHKIFLCSCHHSGLIIEKFDDEPQIYMSKYECGNYRPTFMQRIKTAWNILVGEFGCGTLDDIILDPDTAEEMGKELFRLSKQEGSSNETK